MLSNFVWMNTKLLVWNHAQAGAEAGVPVNQAWTVANRTKSSKIIEHFVPTMWNETLCTRQVLFDTFKSLFLRGTPADIYSFLR